MANVNSQNSDYVIVLHSLSEALNIPSDRFVVKQRFDGGMGTCYRIDDVNGKSYALKVIHPELLPNEHSKLRYIEELKLWKTFSACDGVVEALQIVRVNEVPCIVSTWMENGDMSSLIKVIDRKQFYQCMDRVISSLKWVNDNYHVIHRDLKPENILIDRDYNAYVSNWGLAKILTKQNNENSKGANNNLAGINPLLTQEGTFVGTALYASPEQLSGAPNIDHRSDIYSLGCIMYEWETGRPPFVGKTIQEIASGHLYSQPAKIGGLFKSSNYNVDRIIMKCLEKYPSNRYQTYAELLSDLREVARKKVEDFVPYVVRERHRAINIGQGEFERRIKNDELGIGGKKGYRLLSRDDVKPYIEEALSLSAIGEHEKAISIYKKLFVREMFMKHPDLDYHQRIAINLSNEYCILHDLTNALNTILSISKAQSKPSAYYINLSNIYINLSDNEKCTLVCEDGLQLYPDDPDLIGNYTIGLSGLNRLSEAVTFAKKRLQISREIHAVCEAGLVMYRYAESLKNKEFPKAIDFYKSSLDLYREALEINPIYTIAMYNIALLLFKMKRYSEAMDYGVEISNIEHGTSETNAFYAARNMLWTSNFDGGLKFCDKWLESYPNSIMLKRVRAEILVDGYIINNYTKDGQPIVERSSLEFFTEIVKDTGHRMPTDIIFLSKIHCWMGEEKEINYGLQLLEWGKSQYPDNWKFNFYLSAFALKYKSPQKALQEAIECQHKAPWRESVYNILANAYSANGNAVMANKMREEYERIKTEKKKIYATCKNL